LWDVDAGRERFTTTGHAHSIHALAVSRDGRTLATGDSHGLIRVWARNDPDRPLAPSFSLSGHQGYVRALAFTPDGRTPASSGDDATLRFWQPQRGQAMGTLALTAPARCLTFNPAGTALHLGEGGTVSTRALATAEEVADEWQRMPRTDGPALELRI